MPLWPTYKSIPIQVWRKDSLGPLACSFHSLCLLRSAVPLCFVPSHKLTARSSVVRGNEARGIPDSFQSPRPPSRCACLCFRRCRPRLGKAKTAGARNHVSESHFTVRCQGGYPRGREVPVAPWTGPQVKCISPDSSERVTPRRFGELRRCPGLQGALAPSGPAGDPQGQSVAARRAGGYRRHEATFRFVPCPKATPVRSSQW